MEVKVDLTPEQINTVIAEAVAKSAIGVELERIIKNQVENLSRSYDNPLEGVVRNLIHQTISVCVKEQFEPQIKEWVTEMVTEKFTRDLFDRLWNKFLN